jgi:leucyl-tRNA synthetase
VNSTNAEISLDGLGTQEAKKKITAWLESKGLGKKTINFKLRDWLFSRQRYWGEPFPIIWKRDAAGNLHHEALPESALPVLPPKLDDYKPTPDGQPPLARAQDWVNLPDGSIRETNTMPQWAGSCWYYLRYLDAKNSSAFISKEVENYWMGSRRGNEADKSTNPPPHVGGYEAPGVDLYVGGTEHAVLHLLYARFWHKVLFDLGFVTTAEPFYKLVNQGIILGEDNQKMSKARGNVVNPDDIVARYGADAFRLYEMFMGPLEQVKPWNTRGVEGTFRFLNRAWRLIAGAADEERDDDADARGADHAGDAASGASAVASVEPTREQLRALHHAIAKVTEDIEALRFNTAISALMELVNAAYKWPSLPRAVAEPFVLLLAPLAPHIAEELWQRLGHAESLAYQAWPVADPAYLRADVIEIPVQVNGKVRGKIQVPAEAGESEVIDIARADQNVGRHLDGQTVKRAIYVRGRIVNFVVGG